MKADELKCQTIAEIMNQKYMKVFFNRNSVCMGDDMICHEKLRIITKNDRMLDIINRFKDEIPWTGGIRRGIIELFYDCPEREEDEPLVIGAYYETDEYTYSYAVEKNKKLEQVLLEIGMQNHLRECLVDDYEAEGRVYKDTAEKDGIPAFLKIYIHAGSSGEVIEFKELPEYLKELCR